jgi:hypothetical protein
MPPADVPVSEIDRRIVEAHRDLGAARTTFARSPSGAAMSACQAAEARLNALLDARLDRTASTRRLSALPAT